MRPRLLRPSVAILFVLSLFVLATLAAGSIAVASAGASVQVEFDEEVPPGNPVVGSDAPGDIDPGDANYELLAVIAVGLIVTGALLIKLERWERRRSGQIATGL